MESNRKNLVLTDMHIRMCTLLRRLKTPLYQEKNLMVRKSQVSYLMPHGVLHSKTTSKIQILDKNAFLSTGCNTALAFRSLCHHYISHPPRTGRAHTLAANPKAM